MEIRFKLERGNYRVNTDEPVDISIPLIFNGEQPNTYNAENASSAACEIGDFTGDTRKGGSCNFEQYKLIPHCNGTHTECVGHISDERISVNSVLKGTFIPSALISVKPENALNTKDTYSPEKNKNDFLLTKKSIASELEKINKGFTEGLIIRTLPNDISKKSRKYMEQHPPFFSLEAMELITEMKVKHLLTDIPSVDRAFDEGKLTAHHIFWDVPQGSHKATGNNRSLNTITEMIYVPNEIHDGLYLLNLQIAAFESDASPSRPVIFRILKD